MVQLKWSQSTQARQDPNLLDGLHHVVLAHLAELTRVVKASPLGLRGAFLQRKNLQGDTLRFAQ